MLPSLCSGIKLHTRKINFDFPSCTIYYFLIVPNPSRLIDLFQISLSLCLYLNLCEFVTLTFWLTVTITVVGLYFQQVKHILNRNLGPFVIWAWVQDYYEKLQVSEAWTWMINGGSSRCGERQRFVVSSQEEVVAYHLFPITTSKIIRAWGLSQNRRTTSSRVVSPNWNPWQPRAKQMSYCHAKGSPRGKT